MAELADHHHAVLMSNPWFAELPAAVRDEIVRRSRERRVAAGYRLFSRGDGADGGWFGLVEGSVRVSGTTADGRESVLIFVEPGRWFGETSLIDGLRRTHDAETHVPSLLLVVSPPDFEDLLTSRPELSRALLRLANWRLRLAYIALEEVATQPLEPRLARQLLGLARAYGTPAADGLHIELHLPQEMLGQLMGVSRQRINLTLKDWETKGLLRQHYGRIVVADRSGLEAMTG
ncbi:MAG: Crp/Fnr family transcriptional regulator [Burkholderiales bacterium]|nr:Crp/Fnr family transcriptional regulator [Burkholderiales bacterium]